MNLPKFVSAPRLLPSSPPGWHYCNYAVLVDGTLALVRVNRDVRAAPQSHQWQEWPDARLRLSCFDGETESAAIEVSAARWPEIDRFTDGRWVVVATRAHRGDPNARLFAVDGSLINSFEIGDGVEQIACAPDGRIWVAYFDEGIFGVADPDGSWPPASSGLAVFDALGKCQWRFALEGYSIADCYALSTSGQEVWASPYAEFPVFCIEGAGVRSWKNSIVGARAITAGNGHVVLAGGYKDNANRVSLLRLDKHEAMPVGELRLPEIAGSTSFLRGRDGVLHAVIGDQWLRIAIADWLAALA
jgi:hypothetical protein